MSQLRLALDALSHWAAPQGSIRRERLAVVLVGAYAVFVATYVPLNRFSIGRPSHVLYLPGEAGLPFIPEFEFLYVLGYGYPVLAVFKLPGAVELRRLLISFGLTLAVAYATYLFFPVYFERPELRVNSVATFLLWLEYHDPSYNHFPSLHVAISWLVFLACRDAIHHHRLGLGVLLGISVSTLPVKQHYFVDIAYGIALALAAWRVSARLDRP